MKINNIYYKIQIIWHLYIMNVLKTYRLVICKERFKYNNIKTVSQSFRAIFSSSGLYWLKKKVFHVLVMESYRQNSQPHKESHFSINKAFLKMKLMRCN